MASTHPGRPRKAAETPFARLSLLLERSSFAPGKHLSCVDARCQTRIAAAARHLGVIQADLAVALSMSVTHKNIFLDKQIPDIKFEDPPAPEQQA